MRDYLIRQLNDEEFFIPYQKWAEVLHPSSIAFKIVQNASLFYLEVEGCKVTFSPEPPGLQITFENCEILAGTADRVVAEILQSVERYTKQKGKVIALQ